MTIITLEQLQELQACQKGIDDFLKVWPDGIAQIDSSKCIACLVCVNRCPQGAIAVKYGNREGNSRSTLGR